MTEREGKDDTRSTALVVFCPDDTAMRLDDSAHNRQAQPAATRVGLARAVRAVETLEDAWQGRGGNALARIGNGDKEHVVVLDGVDGDNTTGWHMAQRVITEIGKDTHEHVGVGLDEWQVIGYGIARLYIHALKFGREHSQHLVDEGRQAHRPALRVHGLRLYLRHQVQVSHQPTQAQRLTHNHAPRRLVILAAL